MAEEVGESCKERKKDGNMRNDFFFLVDFGYKFLPPQGMESTSIYKGWKRDILSLLVSNIGP
jgi:hypothetical protein